MTTREKTEVYPTLKVSPKKSDVNAVQFTDDMQVSIVSVKDADTKFGKKIVAVVENQEDGKRYSVFLNNISKNNLIDAFGGNDELWKGKICDLKLEESEGFENENITFHPVA